VRILKQYAQRDIVGFASPYADPFAYRTLADLGNPVFVSAFARVCAESQGADVLGYLQNPEAEFNGLIELAGCSFDANHWLLAFHAEELAGMVLPQRFPELPQAGTLLHIALVPEFRRRGYGKVLHAKGLERLAGLGVVRYVGSTHVDNTAMIRVFQENGCRLTAVEERRVQGPA
jgi:RimJ/RimL family protein N-acetyltransferase